MGGGRHLPGCVVPITYPLSIRIDGRALFWADFRLYFSIIFTTACVNSKSNLLHESKHFTTGIIELALLDVVHVFDYSSAWSFRGR